MADKTHLRDLLGFDIYGIRPVTGERHSGDGVEAWLRKCGFEILKDFGGRGSRAIFWTKKI